MDERQSLDLRKIFREIEQRGIITASKSKFRRGQIVIVTEDVDELVRYLRKMNKNFRESILIANNIAGRVMEVQNIEELYGESGKGIYVTVECGLGYWYLLPEKFLKDYRER